LKHTGGGGHRLPFHYKENTMSKIPSDIKTADEARHWLRVNGFSAEKTESLVREWSESTPAPAPVIEEVEVEEEEDEVSTSLWKSKKK
jgi:hypothetical protein